MTEGETKTEGSDRMETLKKLVGEAIKAYAYEAHFRLNPKATDLKFKKHPPHLLKMVRRARAAGVAIHPLWPGHVWPE